MFDLGHRFVLLAAIVKSWRTNAKNAGRSVEEFGMSRSVSQVAAACGGRSVQRCPVRAERGEVELSKNLENAQSIQTPISAKCYLKTH